MYCLGHLTGRWLVEDRLGGGFRAANAHPNVWRHFAALSGVVPDGALVPQAVCGAMQNRHQTINTGIPSIDAEVPAKEADLG